MSKGVLGLVLGFVTMGLALAGYRYVVRRLWQGNPEPARRLERIFSAATTKPMGKGLTRAYPAMALAVLLMGASLTAFSLGGMFDTGGLVAEVMGRIGMLAAIGFVLIGFAQISVVLLNWPRFLIPPHLRHESGMLADALRVLRGGGRRSRSGRSDRSGRQ